MKPLTIDDVLEINHKGHGRFYVRKDHPDLAIAERVIDEIEYFGQGYLGNGIVITHKPFTHPQLLVAVEPGQNLRHTADYYPEKLKRILQEEEQKKRRKVRVVHLTPVEGKILHVHSAQRSFHATSHDIGIHLEHDFLQIHYQAPSTTSNTVLAQFALLIQESWKKPGIFTQER
ncbi:MAG TPA: hypothetical protein VJB87_05575 [Candidatus Nanoarchaeia archaeon]|nr:hypothetical protein [Candidatus Nanoarchaeia archaeon]